MLSTFIFASPVQAATKMQSRQDNKQAFIAAAPKKRRFYAFLFFLAFSSALWLFVKLANTYTVAETINISLTDPPVEYWISQNQSQHQVSVSITSTGYNLLKFYSAAYQKNTINLPVNQLAYRKQNQELLYLTTSSLKSYLSSVLDLHEGELELNDGDLFFSIEPLLTKKVAIQLNYDLQFSDQFGLYGLATTLPDSVLVYAPKTVLDTIRFIPTQIITSEKLRENFSTTTQLVFDPALVHITEHQVTAKFIIEKFTEANIEVKIIKPSKPRLRLFPSTVKLTVAVATKDFINITEDQFSVTVDTTGLAERKKFLSVRVLQRPDNMKVTQIFPDQIEYILLK